MKPPSIPKLEKRAIKAGSRKFKKADHVPTREEILQLRVQVASAKSRWLLGILGTLLMTSAYFNWFEWPVAVVVLETIIGLILILMSIHGKKRTLFDSLDQAGTDLAFEGIGGILDKILDGILDSF